MNKLNKILLVLFIIALIAGFFTGVYYLITGLNVKTSPRTERRNRIQNL